jgi:putative transcriptional regulator
VLPTVTPIRISLREARERANLTQMELAERAGVRQATISEMERGLTTRVDLDVLDRICGALGVEPGSLLVREPKRKEKGRGRGR